MPISEVQHDGPKSASTSKTTSLHPTYEMICCGRQTLTIQIILIYTKILLIKM